MANFLEMIHGRTIRPPSLEVFTEGACGQDGAGMLGSEEAELSVSTRSLKEEERSNRD